MSSIMVTFLFIKNVKTHNKTIEGSASYLEEEEYKQIFFKGFVGLESLVASFDVNAIIQTTGRFVVVDGGWQGICMYMVNMDKKKIR